MGWLDAWTGDLCCGWVAVPGTWIPAVHAGMTAVRYQPPTPAKILLEQFWALEKEAEKMLDGLAVK